MQQHYEAANYTVALGCKWHAQQSDQSSNKPLTAEAIALASQVTARRLSIVHTDFGQILLFSTNFCAVLLAYYRKVS